MPNFSSICKPLNELLRKDAVWQWTNERDDAFSYLKEELCTEGRALRRADPSLPYILYTDWSAFGIGAVLAQPHPDGNEYMVACISRSLNKHESNYSSYEGEMLGAVWAIKTLRPYLHGHHFTVVTDHQPLVWLMTNQSLTGKHCRWALSLQEFDFQVRHRPGKSHNNADVPSRFPRSSAFDGTGARLDGCASDPAAAPSTPLSVAHNPDGSLMLATALVQVTAVAARNAAPLNPTSDVGNPPSHLAAAATSAPLTADSLLRGNDHSYDTQVEDLDLGFAPEHAANLRRWAATAAACSTASTTPTVLPATGPARAHPAIPPRALNIDTLPGSFFLGAATEGIVMLELCGGLAAGLEMALRNGVVVTNYIYCDICPVAQAVARHRVLQLAAQYPAQLSPHLALTMCDHLPCNVQHITRDNLISAGAQHGAQWLVVAGWECQDLSPAGGGKGLDGPRSRTFYDVQRVLAQLQELQPCHPPAYLLENTAMHFNFNHPRMGLDAYAQLVAALGTPITLDAAQFNSRAHRLRNFWTNLAPAHKVQHAALSWRRAPGLTVDGILDPHRASRLARRNDTHPFYPCNREGQPLAALPTLMARPNSYAFRGEGAGLVYDANLESWVEPTAGERERALGYAQDTTAAPGVTESQRRGVLGRCIDANIAQALFALCRAIAITSPEPFGHITAPIMRKLPQFIAHTNGNAIQAMHAMGWSIGDALGKHGTGIAEPIIPTQPTLRHGVGFRTSPLGGGGHAPAAACSTEAAQPTQTDTDADGSTLQTATEEPSLVAEADIWRDVATLHYLREGTHLNSSSPSVQRRTLKRAKLYLLLGDCVWRTIDGRCLEVPAPCKRADIMADSHRRTGHWGARRTTHLIRTSYWWAGMGQDVSNLVGQCELCTRVNVSFNATQANLQPLPVNGLFYRWGVDLTGPFPTTVTGHQYVMVCIEHFSKQIELIPLRNKEAKTTRAALLTQVIGRYGSCAEILTDQGTEFQAEFDDLLRDLLIDHRRAAPNHPQTDGLAERAVQSVKRALKKHCEQSGDITSWDVEGLPWIALGYNCSKQASTGYSPYFLLHGVDPVIPPATKQRFTDPVDFNCPHAAETQLLDRAGAMRQAGLLAFGNILIAQHRDTLRYATIRSGVYHPRLRKFEVGDFVYLRQGEPNTRLDISHYAHILKVSAVKPSGNLMLMGKCGMTVVANPTHCAPCHLPYIDPTIEANLAKPSADLPCKVCSFPDQPEQMLLCDSCNTGWHMHCLQPKLTAVPKGVWVCPDCIELGVDAETVDPPPLAPPPAARRSLFPSTQAKKREQDAQQLDGMVVVKSVLDSVTRTTRLVEGTARYMPAHERAPGEKLHLSVTYADGSVEELSPLLVRRRAKVTDSATSSHVQPDTLPDFWCLTDAPSLSTALQSLMPGTWAASHITRLSRSLNDVYCPSKLLSLPLAPTSGAEVESLCDFLDLTQLGVVLDPWVGTGTVARVLESRGVTTRTNDLNPSRKAHTHLDALQPGLYRSTARQVSIDGVITSPWFAVLDIALPLAVLAARTVACVHVPGHYVTDAHPARCAYLKGLMAQGRLHILWNLPKGAMGRRCGWLLVFASSTLRDLLINPERRLSAPFSFV